MTRKLVDKPTSNRLLFGVQPLLGEVRGGPRGLDALGVHVDLPGGVADLLDRAAPRLPLRRSSGLRALELRARVVGLLGALPERIRRR